MGDYSQANKTEREAVNYREFLQSKTQDGTLTGFKPLWIPDFLFDFQQSLVDWNIRKGKSATFADCGLGKTPMQLVWAENVVRESNRPVLILTPLAVAPQTVREGQKFGIEVTRSSGTIDGAGIYVTNYEKLHHFNPRDFAGVVCDESSAIKAFDRELCELADRHYSRGLIGSSQFMPPGRTLVLRDTSGEIVFGWLWCLEGLRYDKQDGFCCTIFRNEGKRRSSKEREAGRLMELVKQQPLRVLEEGHPTQKGDSGFCH